MNTRPPPASRRDREHQHARRPPRPRTRTPAAARPPARRRGSRSPAPRPATRPTRSPRTPGSASGLRNSPCSAAPATASAPPATKPTSTRGSRTPTTTVSRQRSEVDLAGEPARQRAHDVRRAKGALVPPAAPRRRRRPPPAGPARNRRRQAQPRRAARPGVPGVGVSAVAALSGAVPVLGPRRGGRHEKPLAPGERGDGPGPTSRTGGRSPSARRKKRRPSVGLLARGSRRRRSNRPIRRRPPLPRRVRRVGREDGLHIQWRDRAGF